MKALAASTVVKGFVAVRVADPEQAARFKRLVDFGDDVIEAHEVVERAFDGDQIAGFGGKSR